MEARHQNEPCAPHVTTHNFWCSPTSIYWLPLKSRGTRFCFGTTTNGRRQGVAYLHLEPKNTHDGVPPAICPAYQNASRIQVSPSLSRCALTKGGMLHHRRFLSCSVSGLKETVEIDGLGRIVEVHKLYNTVMMVSTSSVTLFRAWRLQTNLTNSQTFIFNSAAFGWSREQPF